MRRRRATLLVAGLLALVAAVGGWWWKEAAMPSSPDVGDQPSHLSIAEVKKPSGSPDAAIFLISDAGGWTPAYAAMAASLAEKGALVIGIDLPKTLALAEVGADCIYLVGDIENASHELQRQAGGAAYRDPIVAGLREGGALAATLVAQSPPATIGRTIAVDPTLGIALKRPLCTGAKSAPTPDGKATVYGLEGNGLPDPLLVISTPATDAPGLAHMKALAAEENGIAIESDPGPADAALSRSLAAAVEDGRKAAVSDLGDLPLTLLPAKPLHDTMAIVISGDGGWRDIDSQIAGVLADRGVPTVGIDSLRYFWSEKPPATIAHDLKRVVERYAGEWGTHRVALVGYSFGADVLPATWAAMSDSEKAKVSVVSLLALSKSTDFQFHVSGWLGMSGDGAHPTLPDVEKMPADRVQCFYGADDADSLCPSLEDKGFQLVETTGGHHFDGDYVKLAEEILARISGG